MFLHRPEIEVSASIGKMDQNCCCLDSRCQTLPVFARPNSSFSQAIKLICSLNFARFFSGSRRFLFELFRKTVSSLRPIFARDLQKRPNDIREKESLRHANSSVPICNEFSLHETLNHFHSRNIIKSK